MSAQADRVAELLPYSMTIRADEGEQVIEIERLLQEGDSVDAGGAGRVERRKHDDRYAGQRRIGLLSAAELPTVHDRHHQIEQDDLGCLGLLKIFERLTAVCRRRGFVAFERQHLR